MLWTSPLTDDVWLDCFASEVTFCTEPSESGIHPSLLQTTQRDVSSNEGDSCTAYNKKVQLTYETMG